MKIGILNKIKDLFKCEHEWVKNPYGDDYCKKCRIYKELEKHV